VAEAAAEREPARVLRAALLAEHLVAVKVEALVRLVVAAGAVPELLLR